MTVVEEPKCLADKGETRRDASALGEFWEYGKVESEDSTCCEEACEDAVSKKWGKQRVGRERSVWCSQKRRQGYDSHQDQTVSGAMVWKMAREHFQTVSRPNRWGTRDVQ